MKRLSTFLLFAFLGFTVAKAQSDLLYVAGENDATPGDAPTLYVGDSADVYVQGGVVITAGTNGNTRGDGLIQSNGTVHIGNYSGVGAGNWTNNTGGAVYAYSKTSVPTSVTNTYAPGSSITYGKYANTISLEYGNQEIIGGTTSSPNSADTTHFFNLSLLDSTVNRTNVHSFKTLVGADIYVGNTANSRGTLDLNDEYLNTQNQIVHIENPSVANSGTSTAISRLYSGNLDNTAPFANPYNSISGGMVIASNVAAGENFGRLARVVNTPATYYFPVGSLVTVAAPATGQDYNLFRPVAITASSTTVKEFGAALVPRDGFGDAGTTMDQEGTPWHNLAGINHQSYVKINQLSGDITSTEQITLFHDFTTNSISNATTAGEVNYPNWSTCGNLPDLDFAQTLTIAQYDNNGTSASWNDICHGDSSFRDYASTCGSLLTVAPNNDFCNNTTLEPSPQLSSTTTVAYQIPGMYYSASDNTQEDYSVAGLFFTVDGGNGSCDGNCAALPLTIISLTGWNVGAENQVQWVTATEENTDYFVVQKSTDGVNFTDITDANGVPAAGFSSTPKTYTFFDKQPNIGNNYYRVKEVFYSLQETSTNTINVPLDKKITIANIYPNPTTSVLNVDFETSSAGTIHIEVFDVLGRLVLSNDNAVAEGNSTITVNTNQLTAGTYFIRLTDENSDFTDTQKFIKVTE